MSDLRVIFLGQSGFRLTKGGSSIIIDPMDERSGDVEGELVYCTHQHFDHVGGVPAFMERNPEASLVGNEEVTRKFEEYSERTVTVEDGDSYSRDCWSLEFVEGRHGLFSTLNLGVIVRSGDFSFGHCGDTITFEGFYKAHIQMLAIPIFGIVTTSPGSAISELEKFDRPLPKIVPMHWVIRNPESFCRKFSKQFPEASCIVPEKGEMVPI